MGRKTPYAAERVGMPAENPSANSQAERASRGGDFQGRGSCGAGDGIPCTSGAHRRGHYQRRHGAGGTDGKGWMDGSAVAVVACAASPASVCNTLTHLGTTSRRRLPNVRVESCKRGRPGFRSWVCGEISLDGCCGLPIRRCRSLPGKQQDLADEARPGPTVCS